MDLVCKGNSSIIICQHARGIAISACEGDTVVDVQDRGPAAAPRPNVLLARHQILLGVHLAVGPDAAAIDGRLRGGRVGSVLAEVVGRVESARHASVELGETVVYAVDDGEAEAAGVAQGEMQLAVLGFLGGVVAGSDVRLEAVKAQSDNLSCCN